MVTCSVCDTAAEWTFKTPFTDVLLCQNPDCRHRFAARDKANRGVYGSVAWDQAFTDKWSARNAALFGELRRRGLFHDRSNVIDIGASRGNITHDLKQMVPHGIVAGMEAAPGAEAVMNHIGARYFADYADVPPELKFDLAVCIEVIEHVDDPVALLKGVRSVLAYGGKGFFTTPLGITANVNPLEAGHLSAYNTPGHVQFFSRASFRIACGRAGFQSIDYIALPEIYKLEPVSQERADGERWGVQRTMDADEHSHLVAVIH